MDLRRDVEGDFRSELAVSVRDMAGDDEIALKIRVCGRKRDEEGECETIGGWNQ